MHVQKERISLFVFTKKRNKDGCLFECKQKKNFAPKVKEAGHKMFFFSLLFLV